MKKIPLRIRFALMASLFLLVACTALTAVSHYSANQMEDALMVMPSTHIGDDMDVPEEGTSPSTVTELPAEQSPYRVFQKQTLIATCLIILIGSVAAYFASGYALRPIRVLSKEVRKRNVSNLDQAIAVPQSADEIQELTLAFNQMLSELQRAFAIQKQFSADAAHELRTPLAVMQAKLDVFSLSEHPGNDTGELIAELNQQVERLTLLIEDLLWFSRDLPLEEVYPVPLRPLLEDVAEELSGLAAEKQIDLRISGLDCTVQGQDRLLERVFYNLMENAIKYSPSRTSVSVCLDRESGRILVTVADQGEGIPEDCREAIFEPFFRVDKSRSRAIGGSGLGLAVCKKILQRHQAFISVAPNNPTGTVFTVEFPS